MVNGSIVARFLVRIIDNLIPVHHRDCTAIFVQKDMTCIGISVISHCRTNTSGNICALRE